MKSHEVKKKEKRREREKQDIGRGSSKKNNGNLKSHEATTFLSYFLTDGTFPKEFRSETRHE